MKILAFLNWFGLLEGCVCVVFCMHMSCLTSKGNSPYMGFERDRPSASNKSLGWDSWAIIDHKRISPEILCGWCLGEIQQNWMSQDQWEGTEGFSPAVQRCLDLGISLSWHTDCPCSKEVCVQNAGVGGKGSHCHLQILWLSASSDLSCGSLWGLWDSSLQMNIYQSVWLGQSFCSCPEKADHSLHSRQENQANLYKYCWLLPSVEVPAREGGG